MWTKAPYISTVFVRRMLAAKYKMLLVLLKSCDGVASPSNAVDSRYSIKTIACAGSTGKAKRKHLNATECHQLARSSRGPQALTLPHAVGSGRGRGDPNRGLYPRTPTKRSRTGERPMPLKVHTVCAASLWRQLDLLYSPTPLHSM